VVARQFLEIVSRRLSGSLGTPAPEAKRSAASVPMPAGVRA